jgi:hypothetical protein
MPRFPLYEPATNTDRVRFADGSTSDYKPPMDTMDDRYAACTDHRVGCDCREANLREDIVDTRAELWLLWAAINRVMGDHPEGCRCSGCEIVQLTHDSDFSRTVVSAGRIPVRP